MKMKFLKCELCGQIVAMVDDKGTPIVCCGEVMKPIEAKVDEKMLNEKHVPVYKFDDGKVIVKIGEVTHPSTNDHFIEWIALVTNKGNQRKVLKPGETPEACFCIADDEVVEEIYAYCNIHSLWKLKVNELDFLKKKDCGCTLKSQKK